MAKLAKISLYKPIMENFRVGKKAAKIIHSTLEQDSKQLAIALGNINREILLEIFSLYNKETKEKQFLNEFLGKHAIFLFNSTSFNLADSFVLLRGGDESINVLSRFLKQNTESILYYVNHIAILFSLTSYGIAGSKILTDFLANSFKVSISILQKEYFFKSILKEVFKTDDNLTLLFKPFVEYIVEQDTHLVDEIFYKRSLPDDQLNKLHNYLKELTGHEFMGYKRPLITEDIPRIPSVINKFLSSAYTDLLMQEDRDLLIEKLILGLSKAISNTLILNILEVSAGLVTICFYKEELENGEIVGDYFSDNPNIRIGGIDKFLTLEDLETSKVKIACIIHELTHYANDILFQYYKEPFSFSDIQSWALFNQITNELWSIYDQDPNCDPDLGFYKQCEYTAEIPAFYMEVLTLTILEAKVIDIVMLEHLKLKNYMEGPLMSACKNFTLWKNLLQDMCDRPVNFFDRRLENEVLKFQEHIINQNDDNLFPHRLPSIIIKGRNYVLETTDLIITIGDEDGDDKYILNKHVISLLQEFNIARPQSLPIFDLAGLPSEFMESDLLENF